MIKISYYIACSLWMCPALGRRLQRVDGQDIKTTIKCYQCCKLPWSKYIFFLACLWAGQACWVFRNLPLSIVWPKNCRKEKTWASIVAVDLNSIVIVSSIMSWWFSWRWSWFLPEQSWPFPASVTQGQAQSISQARDRVPEWFSPWTISWSYLYFQGGFHKHFVTLSKCYITGRDRSLLVANITP